MHRERERERQRHSQREKQAPYREPDVELDPGPPGSCPERKAGTKPWNHPGIPILFFLRSYLVFMRDRERERKAETQAEGEAGSIQGARCGTRYQDSRITPWAEGGAKPLSHPGCPFFYFLKVETYD